MEVEDKDVVIAMVQSVCLKDYPPEIFSGFGLAIYDECHHLGAEMFSRAFRRIVTKWTLGLSATPNRKDGLRRVFEWHLGRVIIQREASRTSDLTLERIRFHSSSGVFPGIYSPQTRSAMITFVCELVERNDLIVQRVLDVCRADERRKVLLLSERRNQLEYIHRALKMNGCDCGFYVGGMKQMRLDESAAKGVILGTFQMASEGMDIPVLNTVILCSPKSDIEQSVGRILRKKHDIPPLVIDVIDEDYENFLRQFYIRHRFYKKMNYRNATTAEDEDEVDTTGVEVHLKENCLFIDV
jgi:superfamily II DNA or RNA helicase